MKEVNLEETLDAVASSIENYNSTNSHTPENLINILRNLSANLFFLESVRASKQKAFEAIVYGLVGTNYSVSKATNEAEVKVPELYMLRRIMTAAYKVLESVRTEISYMKSEKQLANNQT